YPHELCSCRQHRNSRDCMPDQRTPAKTARTRLAEVSISFVAQKFGARRQAKHNAALDEPTLAGSWTSQAAPHVGALQIWNFIDRSLPLLGGVVLPVAGRRFRRRLEFERPPAHLDSSRRKKTGRLALRNAPHHRSSPLPEIRLLD